MPFAANDSLDPEGPVAQSMADLWWLMLIVGGAVFVLFTVLMGVGLLRRRGSDRAEEPEATLTRRWIVWGGVVMPTVILVVIFAATVVVMRDLDTSPPEDALVIEVVGRQFSYEVRYPDEGVVADELHLPVGRPVELRLRSEDVIHSLWVPSLGGKTDMLPDHENSMVLQADEPGEHRTQCAEFCGLEHATMRLLVVAEPEDDFRAWVDEQRSSASGEEP